ncbi:MAG: methyltransferase domain-containing protein [Acidobacteriota bacterium]
MHQEDQSPATTNRIRGAPKSKACLLRVMERELTASGVDRTQPVLVIGGGQEDLEILTACGFTNIVLSNLDDSGSALDAEAIAMPDASFSIVCAHAILHHCQCPPKALGEMVRVARDHVFFLEPNDSSALRFLERHRLSFPYELAAVSSQSYRSGGMRDGPIPNYIYRWTGRDVLKCIASYQPERKFNVRAYPFWDFYVNEFELLSRRESRVAQLAATLGPANFIRLLHATQVVLNLFPPLRSQGNKFFASISKRELQPWIEKRDGQYSLRQPPQD